MDFVTVTTSLLILISVSVLVWIKRQYKFWRDLGVTTRDPSFFVGDLKDVIAQKMTFHELNRCIYDYLKLKKVKFGGCYFLFRPLFVPVDPDLIKNIMVKDFDHFVDRGVYFDEENDPLTAHLFSIEGKKWKNLRMKLTPTFTSGKMKMMFPAILDCGKNFIKEMDKLCATKEPIDMKDMLARFNTDVIASVAFGLETNSVSNPNSEFHVKGDKVFAPGPIRQVFQILMFAVPSVTRFFKLKMLPSDVSDFYFNVIRDTLKYREEENISRKDFMQLLIQLKNKGFVDADEDVTSKHNISDEKLTFNELAAQAFVFFLAGFETSSTTETFCLYQLAANADMQQKLREEICETLKKHDGELTYDGVLEMTFLDKVVSETLRMYAPISNLNRICVKEYKVPGADLIIKPGMKIFIPVMGLHYDEEYYPNPEVFDPERFSDENKRKRHPFTYLPFGEGPRNCIGMRFGLMQTKIGIISLIKNYKIRVNSKTTQPIEFDPKYFIASAKGGVWLDLEKIPY